MRTLSVKELKMVSGGLALSGAAIKPGLNGAKPALLPPPGGGGGGGGGSPVATAQVVQNGSGIVTGANFNWANGDNFSIGGSAAANTLKVNVSSGDVSGTVSTTNGVDNVLGGVKVNINEAATLSVNYNSSGVATGTVVAHMGNDSATFALGSNGVASVGNIYHYADGTFAITGGIGANGVQSLSLTGTYSNGDGLTCSASGGLNSSTGYSFAAFCDFSGFGSGEGAN